MEVLAKLWKIAFGVLSVVLGLLIILRIFPDELNGIACAISDSQRCGVVGESEPTVKIGSLIHQLQEGVKQVQQLNATQKDPHMFFVDGLQLELLFTVKETSDNKLDLVVVPAAASAGTENTNSQKLVLKFSTTTDERIQNYIDKGCQPDSLMAFDVRLEQYCRAREALQAAADTDLPPDNMPPTAGQSAERVIDLGEVGITWREFSNSREFGYGDGASAPLTSEDNVLCRTYGICPDTTVQRFDYDADAGTVSSFNIDVTEQTKGALLEALEKGEVETNGWQIEDNPAGGVVVIPGTGG